MLPIVEIDFAALPRRAAHLPYEAKWIWDTEEAPSTSTAVRPTSARAGGRHRGTVLAAYRVLRCRDWARIDVRCDEQGRPHILEINPLPGIHPSMNSCLPQAARAAGLDYNEMILSVLRAAAARHGLTL